MFDLVVTQWFRVVSALIGGRAGLKAADDARRAAEAKADDARRAAEAKAAEEARRATEANAAEDARRRKRARAGSGQAGHISDHGTDRARPDRAPDFSRPAERLAYN